MSKATGHDVASDYDEKYATDKHRYAPSRLAARAVDLSPSTYKHICYILDGKAEEDIEEAVKKEQIESEEGEKLKTRLKEDVEKVKRDDLGVRTADNSARRRLRKAKAEHPLTEEQRRFEAAKDAIQAVLRKAKSLQREIIKLKDEGHLELLGGLDALHIVSSVKEIVNEVHNLSTTNKGEEDVDVGHVSELEVV